MASVAASRALMYSGAANQIAPQAFASGAMIPQYPYSQPQSTSSSIIQSFVSPTGLLIVAVVGVGIFLFFKGGSIWSYFSHMFTAPADLITKFTDKGISLLGVSATKVYESTKSALPVVAKTIGDGASKVTHAIGSVNDDNKLGKVGNSIKNAGTQSVSKTFHAQAGPLAV